MNDMQTYEAGLSLEETIEHFGVKGMKWGTRKSTSGGSSGSSAKPAKKAKPTAAEIKNARVMVESRRQDINNQIVRTNLATGKQKAKEAAKLNTKVDDLMNDPSSEIAGKMTKGEKAITAVVFAFAIGSFIPRK